MQAKPHVTVRLATLDELIAGVISVHISPVPHRDTIRAWLDRAKVPRMKSNPTAKRGGGRVYYNVAAVEKMLRDQRAA